MEQVKILKMVKGGLVYVKTISKETIIKNHWEEFKL